MKILTLLFILMLVGCSVIVPVKQKFPDAPPELLTSCNELKLLEKDTTKLSIVIDSVVENYGSYHECRIKLESWKKWHETQKIIYNN